MTVRRGQAIIETVIAVVVITFLFLALFQLLHMVTARVLLDHAAARAVRARAVGLNDFMCLKSARVAMIPVAGECTWPNEEKTYSEMSRIPSYLQSENEATARGILEYERWETLGMKLDSEHGFAPKAEARLSLEIPRFLETDDDARRSGDEYEPIVVNGKAEIESHFPFYMDDQGLGSMGL